MTVNSNELLSALVDGELTGEELDLALRLLNSDEQARQQWQRYQLSSDIMHGYKSGHHNDDLSRRISAALSKETPYNSVMKSTVINFPTHYWKQAVGFAMAASFGALAVVGVMTQSEQQLLSVQQVAAVTTSVSDKTVATSKRWTVGEDDVEQRLDTYLLDHNEYAGASGVFSYARVVSYPTGQ